MKNLIVYPVLLLSMIAAVYFFSVKFDKPSDIDRLHTGLKGIDKYLSAGSSIVFVGTTGPDILPSLANCFLTPVELNGPPSHRRKDTTLFLLPLTLTDASINTQLNNSSILWKNQDDKFQYILATAKDGAK